jgi:small GTP-binding protein
MSGHKAVFGGVGKTLLFNLLDDQSSDLGHMYQPTISGSDLMLCLVANGNVPVSVQVWDTAGQERYRGITRMYFQDIDVAIIVFDLADRTTFAGLSEWVQLITDTAPCGVRLLLVGNKSNLPGAVEFGNTQEMADQIHAQYFETSALSRAGVHEFRQGLADVLVGDVLESPDIVPVSLRQSKSHRLASCC